MPKHTAFIDLEEDLSKRWRREFARLNVKKLDGVERAVQRKEWDKAHEVVDTISLDRVAVSQYKYMDTLAVSAMLLGASRLKPVRDAKLSTEFDPKLVKNYTSEITKILSKNGDAALKLMLHKNVGDAEMKDHIDLTKAERDSAKSHGNNGFGRFSAISASLFVSRMASYGFLVESMIEGVTTYIVNEIMDSQTCPVCRTMNNKTFPVESGMQKIEHLMGSPEEAAAHIAPWPKQSREAVSSLGKMSTGDLMDAGYSLPPYHPLCRGIVDSSRESKTTSNVLAATAGVVVGALYGSFDEEAESVFLGEDIRI